MTASAEAPIQKRSLTGTQTKEPEMAQTIITDATIERNRVARAAFALLCLLASFAIPSMLFAKFNSDWYGGWKPGFFLGLMVGMVVIGFAYKKFTVTVDLNRSFVTIDQLRALFVGSDVYVIYGPGWHISYPWESRQATNNVSHDEASEDFVVLVITGTGAVTVKGSYRIRPRFGNEATVAFLGGVAVIAADIGDFIKSFITEQLAGSTITAVLATMADLNAKLKAKFTRGVAGSNDPDVSDLEERFGIDFGDVTVAELRLSPEAEKTRSGIDEATIIAEGTAILLGFRAKTIRGKVVSASEQMEKARSRKKDPITQDAVDRARDRFMAVSDNLQMKLSTNEIILKVNANPNVTDAIATLGPALAPVLAALLLARQEEASKKP